MDDPLATRVCHAVQSVVDSPVGRVTPLGGGDVAAAYRVDLGDGSSVFAKTHRDPPPGFFLTEAAGLEWLGEAGAVRIPRVLAAGDDPAVLVLEWIIEGPPSADTEEELGRALAALHRAGAPCFGRQDRRPTGSRSLPNDPAASWAEFYGERRLRPLAALAERSRVLDLVAVEGLHRIADRLGDLVGPPEPPARLHGDLWGGNRLIDRAGRSWLIDPAVFGGHREFDLAMMRLFGGFGPAVFESYAEVQPLADGWRDRVSLNQLAPLAVHAIKFGGGYVGATRSAISEQLDRTTQRGRGDGRPGNDR